MQSVFCGFLCLFLAGCGGGQEGVPNAFSGAMHCGVSVGETRLMGVVTKVHDGDTITVNGQSIRLAGLDAPELEQAYGVSARDQLSQQVLGQQVTVAYSQKDRYDRVLGTVFKTDCSQVNLRQVALGAAWYYEAYRCDLDAQLQTAYETAQKLAQASSKGLWAAPAVAPWVFRNGESAPVPASCPQADRAA